MKNLFLAMIAFTMFYVVACTPEKAIQETDAKSSNPLVGKWRLTEYYLSIGGPGEWRTPSEKEAKVIEFTADGKFHDSATPGVILDYSYTAADSTLIFSPTENGVSHKHHVSKITSDILHMSNTGCIEGCGERYKAVK